MPEIDLSAGTIEYEDTGGNGPVVVLLHGATIDSSVWRHVVADLRSDFRCVLPTLPLGSHRRPMRRDADLSLRGLAVLVGEFLERLDLRDVTLVLNYWGGAQLLISEGRADRVGRLVLTSCEAFDSYPPGLPGRALTRLEGTGGPLPAHAVVADSCAASSTGVVGLDEQAADPSRDHGRLVPPRADPTGCPARSGQIRASVPPKKTLLDLAEQMRSFDRQSWWRGRQRTV